VDDLEGTAIARLRVTRTKPSEGFNHGGAVPFSAHGSGAVGHRCRDRRAHWKRFVLSTRGWEIARGKLVW